MLVEHAIGINLDRRPDRLADFNSKVAGALGLTFERFPGIDGQSATPPEKWGNRTPGAWGCFASHRAVIEKAFRADWDRVLVCEDDALPLYPTLTSEIAEAALNEFPADGDLLYLGLGFHNTRARPPVRVSNHLLRLRNASYTTAIVYSRSGVRKVKEIYDCWEEWPNVWQIDHALNFFIVKRYLEAYSTYPTLFGQTPGISDNTGSWSSWVENSACQPRHFIDRTGEETFQPR